MGHLLFCILHFLAFLFGLIGLFITIPLHIIYSILRRRELDNEPESKSKAKMERKNDFADTLL